MLSAAPTFSTFPLFGTMILSLIDFTTIKLGEMKIIAAERGSMNQNLTEKGFGSFLRRVVKKSCRRGNLN